MIKIFRIIFNKNSFLVKSLNRKRVFSTKSRGLHTQDIRDSEKGFKIHYEENKKISQEKNISLVTTIDKNKNTKNEIKREDLSRKPMLYQKGYHQQSIRG